MFSHQDPVPFSLMPLENHIPRPYKRLWFYHPKNIWKLVQIMNKWTHRSSAMHHSVGYDVGYIRSIFRAIIRSVYQNQWKKPYKLSIHLGGKKTLYLDYLINNNTNSKFSQQVLENGKIGSIMNIKHLAKKVIHMDIMERFSLCEETTKNSQPNDKNTST
jgi:hypothetical protein